MKLEVSEKLGGAAKGGGGTDTGTTVDAGTQHGVQGRAAEAGGWRVVLTPRWAALHTGRGGGERVKQEGFDEERLLMGRRQERGGNEDLIFPLLIFIVCFLSSDFPPASREVFSFDYSTFPSALSEVLLILPAFFSMVELVLSLAFTIKTK